MKHYNIVTTLIFILITSGFFSCSQKTLSNKNQSEKLIVINNEHDSKEKCELVCFNTDDSRTLLDNEHIYYRKKTRLKNEKFNTSNSSHHLFKRSIDNSNEILLKTHINPYKMEIYEDNMYCIDDIYGDFYCGTLFKISTDGSSSRILTRDKVSDFKIHEGWIYYIDPIKNRCKKMSLDGSKDTILISSKNIKSLLFFNDKMYLLISNMDTQFPEKPFDLYSFSEENNSLELIQSSVNTIKLYKDYKYFIDSNDNFIYRQKINSTKREILSNAKADCIKMEGNYIYFKEEKRGNPECYAYCRMMLDGSEQIEICSCKKTSKLNLYKEMLYFAQENNLVEINPDGSKKILKKIPLGFSIQNITYGVLFYLYTENTNEQLSTLGFYNLTRQ